MNASANPSVLGRLLGAVVMAVMLVLGLMFSMVLVVVVLAIGALAFGYFWWKTRALRQAMKEHVAQVRSDGQVFEGEAVIIEEWQGRHPPSLPIRSGRTCVRDDLSRYR